MCRKTTFVGMVSVSSSYEVHLKTSKAGHYKWHLERVASVAHLRGQCGPPSVQADSRPGGSLEPGFEWAGFLPGPAHKARR